MKIFICPLRKIYYHLISLTEMRALGVDKVLRKLDRVD